MSNDSTYTPTILSVRTMKPEEYRGWLHDASAPFLRFNAQMREASSAPLIDRLSAMGPEGALLNPPTIEELRFMGNAAYNLWLRVTVPDSQGRPLELESEEFILWQRSEQAHLPPDVWAAQNHIGLTASPREFNLAGDHVEIEQGHGESRVIFQRGEIFPGARREGHYGSMEWRAEADGRIIHNNDGRPDAFYTAEEFARLQTPGASPTDPIVMMDLAAANGSFDETKAFFGVRTADEARALEGSSFTDPAQFATYNNGAVYHTIGRAQFEAWREDIRQHPEKMEQQNQSFAQWVEQTWGSRERFDAIFQHPFTRQLAHHGLSGTELNEILGSFNGPDRVAGGNDDLTMEQIATSAVTAGLGTGSRAR